MRMAIDVKDPGAGDAVIAEIRNQHCEEQVLFWSKHEPNLRLAARSAPDLEIAVLRDTTDERQLRALLDDTKAFGAGAISAHWSQVDEQLAERCRADDIKLYSWCKTQQIDPVRLALLDGLVTDWPAAGRAAVAALGA
jgi:glycerophosphoryl diester phosphodiesterase